MKRSEFVQRYVRLLVESGMADEASAMMQAEIEASARLEYGDVGEWDPEEPAILWEWKPEADRPRHGLRFDGAVVYGEKLDSVDVCSDWQPLAHELARRILAERASLARDREGSPKSPPLNDADIEAAVQNEAFVRGLDYADLSPAMQSWLCGLERHRTRSAREIRGLKQEMAFRQANYERDLSALREEVSRLEKDNRDLAEKHGYGFLNVEAILAYDRERYLPPSDHLVTCLRNIAASPHLALLCLRGLSPSFERYQSMVQERDEMIRRNQRADMASKLACEVEEMEKVIEGLRRQVKAQDQVIAEDERRAKLQDDRIVALRESVQDLLPLRQKLSDEAQKNVALQAAIESLHGTLAEKHQRLCALIGEINSIARLANS